MNEEKAAKILLDISKKKKELKELRGELKGFRMAELGKKLEDKPEEVWFEGQSPVQRIGKKSYNFNYDEEKEFPSLDTLPENYFKGKVQKIRDLTIGIEELEEKKQLLGLE